MRTLFKMLCAVIGLCMVTSCVITEAIVFNEDMSGAYTLTYDLSDAKNASQEFDTEGDDNSIPKKKQDTTVVFNELLEHYKDSIATLSKEEQAKLEKLKGLTMRIQEDETIGMFKFSISRTFASVDALATINEQVEEAMNIAMTFDNKGASAEQMKDSSEPNTNAIYTFEKNIFTRIQPETISENDLEIEHLEDDGLEDNEMAEQMDEGIDEMTKDAFYVLSYTFPKKIKSVSTKDAVISQDGKTFTLKIPWDSLTKNEDLLNLQITLED